MPYPLTTPSAAVGGRVRLLPPWGCPGDEEWVLHQEVDRWRQLGYRLGPVPALPLELFWHPADSQWNEPLGSAAIRLRIDPRALVPQPVVVDWGDGTSETLSWDPIDRVVPNPRHVYQERSDLTVTVQIGMTVASLAVALVGCPLPPTASRPSGGSSGSGSLGGVEPLVPGGGIQGNAYNGSTAQQWQLRLHPEGGLALLPSPVDGEPSLAVMYGSGAASRGTRWYSGDGPPDTPTLAPPPVPGDLYLDRVSGQVFELMV